MQYNIEQNTHYEDKGAFSFANAHVRKILNCALHIFFFNKLVMVRNTYGKCTESFIFTIHTYTQMVVSKSNHRLPYILCTIYGDISFFSGSPRCMDAKSLQSCLTLCDPMDVAHQAPLSMGFARQEYRSGLPCPPPGDPPNPEIKPVCLTSPILAGGFFTTNTTWEVHPHTQEQNKAELHWPHCLDIWSQFGISYVSQVGPVLSGPEWARITGWLVYLSLSFSKSRDCSEDLGTFNACFRTIPRVGLWRKLSEELMLLNCGVGEDSWESLGLQGDPTSPFWRRSALGVLWREWC